MFAVSLSIVSTLHSSGSGWDQEWQEAAVRDSSFSATPDVVL